MCGIVGSLEYEHGLDAALQALRRRGPDDTGRWSDPERRVALGHARLSIIDTSSAGHQPMVSHDGRVVMTYNGEIYNYRELRSDLEARGVRFLGNSDSEVLLALFCLEGIGCLARLNGIFAVAFWERDSGTLFLARDPLGVKPLYIHHHGHRFAFASEIKALVRGGYCDAALDPEAALAHLCYLWSPGERTVAAGVRKVLPGEALCVRQGAVERRWFYSDLSYEKPAQPLPVDAAAAQVGDAVRVAVERQLVSDVPLGAFLSGGLDSSAVVAFAARAYPGPGRLQCFSIKVEAGAMGEEGFADDLPYAERVARHLGVDLHVVEAGQDMIGRLDEMIYLLDEPTADPAALSTLYIAELARKHGIKVLLSGSGGDDIFSGYRRHFALMQERWWAGMPATLRRGLSAVAGAVPASSPPGRRLNKAFRDAHLEADERMARYFTWLSPERAVGLLSPEFRAGLGAESATATLRSSLRRLPQGTDNLDRMLYLECKHFLADHNLNYTDKMAMAAGVEVRVPLLDMDLVKLAGSLPSGVKQHGAVGKWIFKRAMERYLPRDVIYRPKTGFGVPLRRWLRGPLKGLVDDILSPAAVRRRGIFDARALERLRADDAAGAIDASYPLFSVLCLELWCRQYVDGHYALDRDAGVRNGGGPALRSTAAR